MDNNNKIIMEIKQYHYRHYKRFAATAYLYLRIVDYTAQTFRTIPETNQPHT